MSDPSHGAISLRWRPSAFVAVGAAGFLLAGGILLRNPVAIFLALPLLIAPVVAAIGLPPPETRLRLRWTEEGSGPSVTIVGQLEGVERDLSRQLVVSFRRPQPLIESAPAEVDLVGGTYAFRLFWKAPYPCVARVGVPEVVVRDPLGLAERPLHVDADPLELERFPPEASRLGTLRLRRTTPVPGEVHSRAIGRSGEFFSVRPAAPGDTPRQINWRATARSGRFLSNDFHQDRTGDIVIVLDLRPTSLHAVRDAKLLSISRAAALGISAGFLREKARVGIALFGEFVDVVPLGSGRAHSFRLRRFLEGAAIAPVGGPAERLAVSLRRYYPPGVTTLLIAPFSDDESLHLLPHLRHRGFHVFVLSPSPVPLIAPPPGSSGEDDRLAGRLMHLARRQRIAQIWEEAPVIDWEDYWSLSGLRGLLANPLAGGRRW